MDRIEVGQEFEFVQPVEIDGHKIAQGTRVRVGYVENELFESKVIVVVLGTDTAETVTLPRHVLMLNCQALKPS
jgi:hypothetical protein